jgi:hypothetical protein
MYRLFSEDGQKRFRRNDAAHGMAYKYRAHRRVDGYDFILKPFLEAADALVQVASCLELGVRDGEDSDFGQCMLKERFHVAWKCSECFISSL